MELKFSEEFAVRLLGKADKEKYNKLKKELGEYQNSYDKEQDRWMKTLKKEFEGRWGLFGLGMSAYALKQNMDFCLAIRKCSIDCCQESIKELLGEAILKRAGCSVK